MSDPSVTPGTDRERLRRAYADSSKFDQRRSLYAYEQPRVDVLGWALDHVPFPHGGRVLDVGCGPGYYLRRLAQTQLTLVGLDLSEGMVQIARREVEAAWAVADVVRLPVQARSFDVVLAMHMLYHATGSARAIAELRRVLRPDGTLLVSTNGREHLARARNLVADALGGRRLDRPSHRFRLEDAGDVLRAEFETVERDELRGEVVVTEPAPVVRHLASGHDFFEPLLPAGTSWDSVLEHVEAAISDEIARSGDFRAGTHIGVFVCR